MNVCSKWPLIILMAASALVALGSLFVTSNGGVEGLRRLKSHRGGDVSVQTKTTHTKPQKHGGKKRKPQRVKGYKAENSEWELYPKYKKGPANAEWELYPKYKKGPASTEWELYPKYKKGPANAEWELYPKYKKGPASTEWELYPKYKKSPSNMDMEWTLYPRFKKGPANRPGPQNKRSPVAKPQNRASTKPANADPESYFIGYIYDDDYWYYDNDDYDYEYDDDDDDDEYD